MPWINEPPPSPPAPDERWDDLNADGLGIWQKTKGFRFGMDAVLLAAFAAQKLATRVADLGTGTGIIPLLLSRRLPKASFDAIEIQQDMAAMAQRSVQANGLSHRIHIYPADLRHPHPPLPRAAYDLITCNPPYGRAGGTLPNPSESLRLARHETTCTLPDVCTAARTLLRNGGRLCMVFPAPRLLELLDTMRAQNIEPKRLQFVHDKPSKSPYLVLCEGMRLAQPGLHLLPPLIVHEEDGKETEGLREYYGDTL